ncbi:MAG: ferredoxin family protein [Myxococcota bacterium]
MTYVITKSCADCLDTGCVDVCPIDVIHGPLPIEDIRQGKAEGTGIQLYIDPDDCIICGACVPECPEQAIFLIEDLPEEHADAAEANRRFFLHWK